MGNWANWCCHGKCLNASDAFDRADSDDPGGNWTEVITDSDIFSNTLKQFAGSLVKHSFAPKDGYVLVDVEMDQIANGDTFRVVVGYIDTSNYYYAEAKWGGGGPWTLDLTLVQVAGGTPTTLATKAYTGITSVGPTWPLKVCFSYNEFFVWVRDHPYWCYTDGTGASNSAWRTGLANGGTTAIRWDKWKAEEHRDAKSICPKCACWCDNDIAPDASVNLTIDSSGECTCLDSDWVLPQTTITDCTPATLCSEWSVDTSPSLCTDRFEFRFTLQCKDAGGVDSYTLIAQHPPGPGGLVLEADASVSTCTPLYLVFNTDSLEFSTICTGYEPHDPPIPIQFIVTE